MRSRCGRSGLGRPVRRDPLVQGGLGITRLIDTARGDVVVKGREGVNGPGGIDDDDLIYRPNGGTRHFHANRRGNWTGHGLTGPEQILPGTVAGVAGAVVRVAILVEVASGVGVVCDDSVADRSEHHAFVEDGGSRSGARPANLAGELAEKRGGNRDRGTVELAAAAALLAELAGEVDQVHGELGGGHAIGTEDGGFGAEAGVDAACVRGVQLGSYASSGDDHEAITDAGDGDGLLVVDEANGLDLAEVIQQRCVDSLEPRVERNGTERERGDVPRGTIQQLRVAVGQ